MNKKLTSFRIRIIFLICGAMFMIIHVSGLCAQQHSESEWELPVTTVSRDTLDGAIYVQGEVFISESREHIWEILTDYDNIETFVPCILEASLVSREDTSIIISQKARNHFLIFRKTIEVTLSVREIRPEHLSFDLVEGPFHYYYGSWTLTNDTSRGGVMLTYRAIVKPDFFSPKFLIRRILRREFRTSLEAIRNETKHRFFR